MSERDAMVYSLDRRRRTMRRMLLVLVLFAVTLSNCAAAPLTARWTMPVTDNAALCGAPPVSSPVFDPDETLRATIYWRRSNETAVRDSATFYGAPGQAMDVVLDPNIPSGIWIKWSFALKTVQGRVYQSCLGNVFADTIPSPTAEVRDLR